MSEDEAVNILKTMCTDNFCIEQLKTKQAIETILDLYQQKCKQNKDAKDYIEYYLLDNMKIEGNAKNTHEELKKLYNTLGGDNLR
jgi:hypothetical protein